MRTAIGVLGVTCACSAALLVAGCGAGTDRDARADTEALLEPVAAPGPNPFTASTATRTPGSVRAAVSVSTANRPRSVSGGTAGLYGGTERAGSCDVDRQIARLTAEPARASAFAAAAGIPASAIPGHLRGLTPVVLRADTQVTNHGYRDGRATSYPSVLQAGTAVLVDDRGLPRVRCASGSPLRPPRDTGGTPRTEGRPWAGYRPGQVVVVTPAPRAVTRLTILDVVTHTWIERTCGFDVGQDRPVPTNPPVNPAASAPAGAAVPPVERGERLPQAPQLPQAPVQGLPEPVPPPEPYGDTVPWTAPETGSDPLAPDPLAPDPLAPDPLVPDPLVPEAVPEIPGTPDRGGPLAVAPGVPDGAAGTDSDFAGPVDVFTG